MVAQRIYSWITCFSILVAIKTRRRKQIHFQFLLCNFIVMFWIMNCAKKNKHNKSRPLWVHASSWYFYWWLEKVTIPMLLCNSCKLSRWVRSCFAAFSVSLGICASSMNNSKKKIAEQSKLWHDRMFWNETVFCCRNCSFLFLVWKIWGKKRHSIPSNRNQ